MGWIVEALVFLALSAVVVTMFARLAAVLQFRLMQAARDAGGSELPSPGLHEAYDMGLADGSLGRLRRRTVKLTTWDERQLRYYDCGHETGERLRRQSRLSRRPQGL